MAGAIAGGVIATVGVASAGGALAVVSLDDCAAPHPEIDSPRSTIAPVNQRGQVRFDPHCELQTLSTDMIVSSNTRAGSLIFHACRFTAGPGKSPREKTLREFQTSGETGAG